MSKRNKYKLSLCKECDTIHEDGVDKCLKKIEGRSFLSVIKLNLTLLLNMRISIILFSILFLNFKFVALTSILCSSDYLDDKKIEKPKFTFKPVNKTVTRSKASNATYPSEQVEMEPSTSSKAADFPLDGASSIMEESRGELSTDADNDPRRKNRKKKKSKKKGKGKRKTHSKKGEVTM